MILELNRESHEPLYEQIAVQIREMIGRGALQIGDRLPANRELARSLGVNRSTVTTAYDELTADGLISSHVGRGAKYVGIPVGPAGPDLDLLEDLLAQRRPKLLYVVPSYHNPTGATMDLKARRRLIEIAARARLPIIEDDIYRELRYDGPVLPPLKALDRYGLVIYVNSFSKIGFPGLRVGWVAASRIVIEHLNAEKQRSDLHASLLAQAAIWEFVRRGALARHLARSRKTYAARRDSMLDALGRHFPAEAEWTRPAGGMALWVRLPAGVNTSQLFLQAADAGVTFSPGESFYGSAPETNRLRLTFTQATPEEIDEGVRRLGAIIKTRLAHIRRRRASARGEASCALV